MKLLRILFLSLFSVTLLSQNDKDDYSFSINNWEMKVVGNENFYPTYLSDPLGVRFEVSSQNMLYSDYDIEDRVNEDGSYLGKLTIVPGIRLSLFKFSPKSNPNLGVEVDLGASIPLVMRAGNHDLIATDGIYYFAIAGRPTEWLNLRFSKHHICTHLGDEFPIGNVYSPVDYDVNTLQLPVRDDMILSAAVKPLYFMKNPQLNILQLYGDFGFFLPGVDFMGTRQNKPHKHAIFNFNYGAELEYYFTNRKIGGVFAAGNISTYQLNAYSKNVSLKAGYILPQAVLKKRLNVGIHYYNGRSLSNQFYNRKEKFIAFSLVADL